MEIKKKLGQILLDSGALDEYQLKSALGFQKKWGGRLGNVLVENRFITEEALIEAVHEQTGIPVVVVTGRNIPDYLIKLVPEALAEKHHLIPIGLEGDAGSSTETLLVALADPSNLDALDEIRFQTGKRVKPVLSGEKAIGNAIALHYRGEQSEGLDFNTEPEQIQFGGQVLEAGNTDDGADMVLVQGTLEPGPAASAPALAGGGIDLEDPFAELDALSAPPPGQAVPAPAPAVPAPVEDPFAELDLLAAESALGTGVDVSSEAQDFDLDISEAEADAFDEIEVIDDIEIIEDIEVIEELEPQQEGASPVAATPIGASTVESPASSAAAAPPPPSDRDTSLFGVALDEAVDSLGPPPGDEDMPALNQAADLTGVPDLDPPTELVQEQIQGLPPAALEDLPDLDPAPETGESLPTVRGLPEEDSGPMLAEEQKLTFGESDDLDLDSILEPISPPDGSPPVELAAEATGEEEQSKGPQVATARTEVVKLESVPTQIVQLADLPVAPETGAVLSTVPEQADEGDEGDEDTAEHLHQEPTPTPPVAEPEAEPNVSSEAAAQEASSDETGTDEKSTKNDAMKALLSRVGLGSEGKAAKVQAADNPRLAPKGKEGPLVLDDNEDIVPTVEAVLPAAALSNPTVAALVRLLVDKGIITEQELKEELRRE